jgi:hypothetical protein
MGEYFRRQASFVLPLGPVMKSSPRSIETRTSSVTVAVSTCTTLAQAKIHKATQRPFLRLFFFGALLCSLSPLGAEEMETWTDKQGRRLEAEFAGPTTVAVLLRTSDGKVHSVSFERLMTTDVQKARQKTATGGVAALPQALLDLTPEQSAERIDRVLEAQWATAKIKPNPPLTDEQFVRRAYLDIAGRIPKLSETRTFLDNKARNKRAVLIDTLLQSPGHHSHLFNFFANLLRLKTRVSEYISGASFIQWIKLCVAENRPYDQMVQEMITASGMYQKSPAAGYLMRDAGMPLDNLSLTAQYFLGTDLSCAQCHDHPFDNWSQRQFYQLAAFMGSTRTLPHKPVLEAECKSAGKAFVQGNDIVEAAVAHGGYDGVQKEAMKRFMNAAQHRVADDPSQVLKLPHDYAYSDAKPGDIVEPKVIFGNMPDLKKFDNNRAAFAYWLTADDNPRFAVTIANRLWARAFGRGVVEPLHDLNDLSETSVPGLIEVLEEEMKRVRYDLRAFEAILYRTRAWQRESSTVSPPLGEAYAFPGPLLRRLSSAQIWDSILTMVLEDPDYFNGKRDYREWEQTFGFDRSIVDGKLLGAQFDKQEALNKRDGGLFGWPKDSEEVRPKDSPLWLDDRCGAWRLYGEVLIRASEMTQPASAGHLLSILGQSDRNLSGSDSTIGSVPIAMALMNGRGSQVITKAGSRILNAVDEFQGDGPKVETVYLSVLSRLPISDERSVAYKTIRRGGKAGFEDVVWALINTREFLFVQ